MYSEVFNCLIPKIPDTRNYWFVRTNSGIYYADFYHEDFIGIGWNKINDIDKIKQSNRDLEEIVRERYPNEKRPRYVANQIIAFVDQISIGDIVLIPSPRSSYITFGEVVSDLYIEPFDEDPEEIGENEEFELTPEICQYAKRKRIKWITTIKREALDPYLFKLIYSQHTVTKASDYAPYIDRTISSLYTKGDKAHLILNVAKKDDIYAKDLSSLISGILRSIDEIKEHLDAPVSSDKLEIKLSVQSPGHIELIGNITEIGFIALIIFGIFGGGVKVAGTEITIDGLINKLTTWLEHKRESKRISLEHERELKRIELEHQRELLKINAAKDIATAFNNLKIKVPEDLNKINQDLDSNSKENG